MNIQKFTSLKKILFVALLCIGTIHSFAQSVNGIFFQAVARDNFSNPAKDRNIYVQSTIIQNTTTGTKVLIETHKSSTDAMGVFNITIGNGQRTGGSATSIAAIDWSKGPFYLNLKIAITPFSASDNWDYTKELIDMGTTSFGAVPFAFYSASSAKVDDKLNATDTTKMLAVYAKAMSVKTLETSLATKLTAADTLTMLAPYAKAAYTIDSNFFRTQLATKFNAADTINYTKRKYTDSAISKKLNIADSTIYVTPAQLAAKTFDQTPITNAIATKLNIADSAKYITPTQLASYNFSGGGGTTIDTSSLSNRINLKANASDITSLTNTIGSKLNLADSTKYVTPTQLASYNFSGGGGTTDTSSLSNRIDLKANAADVASTIAATTSSINTNTTAIGTLNTTVANNTANISSNTTAITAEATTARAAELTLTNNVTSNTVSITANATAITAEATTARAAELTLTNNINCNTASITANASAISSEALTARAAELALSNNITTNTNNIASNTTAIGNINTSISANTTSITAISASINSLNTNVASHTLSLTANIVSIGNLNTSVTSNITNTASNTTAIGNLNTSMAANTTNIATNTSAIAAEATTARAAELTLTNNVASNTASITANKTSINNLNTNVVSNISSINSLNTTIAAATNSNTANTIVKRDASGNFSAGTINATTINTPIYASSPQVLTDGATISWNPTLGLNASVTLAGNRTLSFFSTPVAGSYGTLVVTQDGTGGRTLTLPSTSNLVLGSSATTTIALSTAANAKDILNFYYDGTNCYWNIGQGYGAAATAPFSLTTTGTGAATLSGTTLNIPSVSSTVNAGSISGTIAVANGGTGATTLTGLVKGNGSGAFTAAVSGTDYLLPTGNAATATLATTATTAGNITATSNTTLTSLSNLNTVGTITSGTISVTTNIKTSSTLTAGTVTYPNTHGTSGQVLSTTGSGTLTWATTAAPSDASTSAKGIVQLAGDLAGTASLPTVNTVGGVSSSTIGTINTTVTAATNNNTVSTIVKRDASGNFSAGTITANLNGNVTGNLTGNATTATTASSVSGTVAIANGGTNATTAANALTNLGAAPLSSPIFTNIPQAPTAIAGTNNTQLATTAFVTTAVAAIAVRITSEEYTATAGQTAFTILQTPLSGVVWMFVNGTRIKNGAYTVSGKSITYNPTNNNSYTLVLNDRIQFDYAY